MAKVTWLGEDEEYADGNGPRFNVWNGIQFEIGKPVEVDDAAMLVKAKGNRFFRVGNPPGRPPAPKPADTKADD